MDLPHPTAIFCGENSDDSANLYRRCTTFTLQTHYKCSIKHCSTKYYESEPKHTKSIIQMFQKFYTQMINGYMNANHRVKHPE